MPDATSVLTEVFPTIEERVLDLSQKLEQLIVTKSPAAWDTLLTVIKIEAVQNLLLGAIYTVVALGFLIWCKRMWARGKDLYDDDPKNNFEIHLFGSIPIFFLFFVSLIAAAPRVSNLWNYVAFISPEVVVAHKVLQGLL